MRALLVLGLLMMATSAACTVVDESYDEAPGGLSLAPNNPNIPPNQDADLACPNGFANGSQIDEYRDGSANLFCD